MAFFSRLFKKTQPLTLQQKIDALSTAPQEELLATINSDAEDPIKHAAIKLLPYSEALLKMAAAKPSHRLETHARKRLGELLDANSITIEQLSQSINDQGLLLTLCGYSANAGTALVAQIDDEALLVELGKTSATTAIRQAAAEKIESYEHLQDLQKVAKNKDKSVYKIIKTKLDAHKQQQAELKRRNEQADAVCHQAEQLIKRDIDDIFYARKEQIQAAWEDVYRGVDWDISQRFKAAIKNCDAKIEEFEAEKQRAQAQEQAELTAKKDVLDSLTQMKQHIIELFTTDDATAIPQKVESTKAQHNVAVNSAKENGLNTHKEEKHFKELHVHATELLAKIESNQTLQQLVEALKSAPEQSGQSIKKNVQSLLAHAKALTPSDTPEAITKAKDAIKEWSITAQEKAEAGKELTNACFDLIRRGHGAINGGQVRRARAISNDLEKTISKLEALPSALETKYQDFKEAIGKLGDWHEFAVTPKKEALIESMKSLSNSTLHPKDLADRIKSLQENWRELSRGGQSDDSTLWENFQEAAKQAYEPCKTYFEEQACEREENAQKRKQLIAQLEEYLTAYDWENANWKEVEKTLRVSREAWQSYWPVARKENKSLQETFDKIADNIYGKLNAEYERNKLKKQSIVDRAKALVDLNDTSAAIDSAKKLQAEWQSIGRSKAKIDQQLWKEFRTHCDAVFDKRKQESEAENNERNAAKEEAEALISKLEAVVTLTGEAFFTAKQEAQETIEAFKNLGELPRNHYKNLQQRFQKSVEAIETQTHKERQKAQWSIWESILTAHKTACQLEAANAEGKDTHELVSALNKQLDAAAKWPSAISGMLQTRMENASSFSAKDEQNNVRTLRTLCIRSEIANDKTSPEDDKALRMEYQVEQLQQGLGNQSVNSNTLEALLSEWVATTAVPEAQYQACEARLKAAWGFITTLPTNSAIENNNAHEVASET